MQPLFRKPVPVSDQHLSKETSSGAALNTAMCPVTAYEADEHCPLHFPFSGSWREQLKLALIFLFSKLDKHRLLDCFSQNISASTFTSFVAFYNTCKCFDILFKCWGPELQVGTPGETAPALNTAGLSPPLAGWWCCVWCTPGWSLPSWQNADSHWARCQPACPGPLQLGCSSATPLLVYTCVQHRYFIFYQFLASCWRKLPKLV